MQKGVFTIFILCFLRLSALAQSAEYPVFSSLNPPPLGIYLTADDFLALHPRDTEVVFQHYAYPDGGGINNFHRRKPNGKKGEKIDPRDCFAGSDGKTFYISYSGKWYTAEKTDSGYCFVAFKSRWTKEQVAHERLRASNPMTGGSVSIASVPLEDLYRMRFSVQDRQWIAVERVDKRRK